MFLVNFHFVHLSWVVSSQKTDSQWPHLPSNFNPRCQYFCPFRYSKHTPPQAIKAQKIPTFSSLIFTSPSSALDYHSPQWVSSKDPVLSFFFFRLRMRNQLYPVDLSLSWRVCLALWLKICPHSTAVMVANSSPPIPHSPTTTQIHKYTNWEKKKITLKGIVPFLCHTHLNWLHYFHLKLPVLWSIYLATWYKYFIKISTYWPWRLLSNLIRCFSTF